jgi:hypothetical protein
MCSGMWGLFLEECATFFRVVGYDLVQVRESLLASSSCTSGPDVYVSGPPTPKPSMKP